MATFTSFSNILPDPVNAVTDAGDISASGTQGPGFASITVGQVKDTQVSRTISGRGVTRESGSHNWTVNIKYNPMFRPQFEPVSAFLDSRNSRLNPFYVIVPQYSKPRDPLLASYVTTKTISIQNTHNAGESNMLVTAPDTLPGNFRPGDMFNIVDPSNANHQKIYRISRVETSAYYQAGSATIGTNQNRIWFNPPLQRNVSASATMRVINPLFRVISNSDTSSYDVNTDNLYSFSLDLEEIQP